MSKILRRHMAKELISELQEIDSFVVFDHSKMTAEQACDLRKQLRDQKVCMKAVKNRVASVAFKEIYDDKMSEVMKEASAIAYGGESPADVAKVILNWNKKNGQVLNIKGGYVPGVVIDAKGVKELSQIPPKPVLLSILAGVFEAPMQQIATIMAAPMQDFSYAVDGLVEKQEKEAS